MYENNLNLTQLIHQVMGIDAYCCSEVLILHLMVPNKLIVWRKSNWNNDYKNWQLLFSFHRGMNEKTTTTTTTKKKKKKKKEKKQLHSLVSYRVQLVLVSFIPKWN